MTKLEKQRVPRLYAAWTPDFGAVTCLSRGTLASSPANALDGLPFYRPGRFPGKTRARLNSPAGRSFGAEAS